MTAVSSGESGHLADEVADAAIPEILVEVSVLVPAHNEEGTIEDCLKRTSAMLKSNKVSHEIIVIDDGSTDKTFESSLQVARANGGSVRIIRNSSKWGKGASLISASRKARGEILVVLDADLEYLPEEMLRVIAPIEEGTSDAVFGSRFKGKVDRMSLSHRIGNSILTGTTNLLYGGELTDVMTGYKAFKRLALEQLKVGESGFGFEVEVAAKALDHGLRVMEVPISYHRRTKGKSKIRWSDGIKCFLDLIRMSVNKLRP